MKRYVFELVIEEGSDEFWESIGKKSGCDEVQAEVEHTLEEHGFVNGENCKLTLKQFSSE